MSSDVSTGGSAWIDWIGAGLKDAMKVASRKVIGQIGKPDGYFGNPEVRIPLPGKLEKLRKMAQTLGASKEVDALVLGINRAAEAALPECRALIVATVRETPASDVDQYRTAMSERLLDDPVGGQVDTGR